MTSSTEQLAPALDVDARLTGIERGLTLLLNVTPVNAAKAWADFERSDFGTVPVLRLRPLEFEPLDREVLHPVVRVHPVTGRKALFVNPVYTQRFEGMSQAESKSILDYLHQHNVRAEFCCRFRWSPNTLTMWDNRCCQHNATGGYDGHARVMHRTTVAGEAPIPVAG